MTMRTSPLLSLTQKKTPKRGCEEMIYIFSQPLFYCPDTGENPQVHRPYGVLCALKLQKGLSIRCPPQSLRPWAMSDFSPLKIFGSCGNTGKRRPIPAAPPVRYPGTYVSDLSRSPLMQIMGLPFLISTSASTSKTSAMASWVMTSIGGPWRWMMPFSRTRRSVE